MALYELLCVPILMLVLLPQGCHPQLSVCGLAPLNTRIVGGQNASAGSWPWQASLQQNGFHFCGGTLINQQWVLTAAHCLSSRGNVTVHLGLHTLAGPNPNEVSVAAAQIIIHSDYDSQAIDNDVALIKLSAPVTFNDHIRPVCLAAQDSTFYSGTDSWLTGWGDVQYGVSLPSPGNLQEVDVPIVGSKQCECSYQHVITITDRMICVGVPAGGKAACQGDSGGPMVSKQGNRWIQSGVSSFGVRCDAPGFPSVYARVSQFQTWITGHIETDPPGFVTFTSVGIDGDLSFTCTPEPPSIIPTLPPSTFPPVTIPPATFPPVTVPLITVPPVTVPPVTIPPVTFPSITFPPVPSSTPVVCGNAPRNWRMGGSSLPTAGIWPWMASLHHNGAFVCGGTLVAEQFVLSDSGCFSSRSDPSEWTVVLGRLKQNGSNPFEVKVNVRNITLSETPGSNVAILQLVNKPTLTDYIQPVCVDLGDATVDAGTQCWVAGWSAGLGGVEQVLQELQTSVVDCGDSSSTDDICTGAVDLQQSVAGGPLMCKQAGSWFEVAVLTVDGGNGEGRAATSVFRKTSSYATFLKSTVGTFPSAANMIQLSRFTLLLLLLPPIALCHGW